MKRVLPVAAIAGIIGAFLLLLMIPHLRVSMQLHYSYLMGSISAEEKYLGMAILNKKKGDINNAIRYYEAAANLQNEYVTPLPYISLSRIYDGKGDIAKAENVLRQGMEHQDNSSYLNAELYRLMLKNKKYSAARTAYEKVEGIPAFQRKYLIGLTYFYENNIDSAVELFYESIETESNFKINGFDNVHIYIAACWKKLGNDEKAKDALLLALKSKYVSEEDILKHKELKDLI